MDKVNKYNGLNSRLVSRTKLLLAATALGSSSAILAAPPLIINNVGQPTTQGSGQGERAIWTNAGSVGGQAVDIVGVVETASMDHRWTTTSSRPSITSNGQDEVFIRWYLYQAGTYNIGTDSGGVPVVADIHVQINDVDGPNNEEVYLPVCQGDIEYVRMDRNATTGRAFGTVAGRPEVFSLIGDQNYSNQPESGVEMILPNRSNFEMGRTANNGFLIRLDNPTYSAFDTLDFSCADFTPPTAVDDSQEGTPGASTTVSILRNDSAATANNNPTNNNSLTESEAARASVNLIAPAGAMNITTDVDGDVSGFVVPGEGTWAYDEITGDLTFTPDPSFVGEATDIDYEFTNALGIASNAATVTIWYPGLGLTKGSVFNDENGDGYGQVGETITYTYLARAYGREALGNITLNETGFTGNGVTPTPVYQSGDTNSDNLLDLSEVWTFTATYALVADDLNSGVDNSATITGQTSGGTIVSDVSDSTNTADGNGSGTSGPGPDNGDPTGTTPGNKPINADNDSQPSTIFGNVGSGGAFNVLGNDTLDGAAADLSNVTLSVTTPASNPGVSLDPASGEVSVAPGTPAGTYTIDYEICEVGNPNNCATARATVVVTAANPINATNDNPASVISSTGGAGIVNVLTNDELLGSAPDIADVDLSVLSPASDPGVTLDTATGLVSVAPGTPAGTYSIDYQICETANPTNCTSATVSVVVDPNPITAAPDSPAPVNGASGGNDIVNAFDNDTLNGAPVNPADITATVTAPATPASPGAPVPVLDPATGLVDVPAGTPSGTYTISYEICETANPASCATSSITVTVVSAPITATVDAPAPVNGASGGNDIINAFDNDTLNGAPVNPADITASVTAPATPASPGAPVPVLDPATGLVDVPAGTPSGTYTIGYEICENLNPTNCATSSIAVTVTSAPITATVDAPPPVNGASGGNDIINAFDNDTLNGAPVDLADITATVTAPATPASPGAPVPVLDPATGLVDVPAGTPSGTYTIGYEICEVLNPTNCATSSITVTVASAPITATVDAPPPVNGASGGNDIINAFDNDTLNGTPVDPADITATVTAPATPASPGAPVPVLDPATGLVDVPAGTPSGAYTIGYEICENLNPTNCATSTVTVEVAAAPIDAIDDSATDINGLNGGTNVLNVFGADTLNGGAASLANSSVSLAPGATMPSELVFDPASGNISVVPGAAAGTYSFQYQLCENLNPTNCDIATASVVVIAAPIIAPNDTPAPVGGATGNPNIGNAYDNDTLNGLPVDPADIVGTVTVPAIPAQPGAPVPSIDPATGIISVPPGTPAGTYTIGYEICEVLNPTNCAQGEVTIVVEAAVIDALPDVSLPINGATGGDDILNAFGNDTYNGSAIDPANIVASGAPGGLPGVPDALTTSIITPAAPLAQGASVPTLDLMTGMVDVAAGTPAGTYTIVYEVCEALNPTNCAQTTVTVEVLAAPIDVQPDAPAPVNGADGGTGIINAFDNDTLNGVSVDVNDVTASVQTPAAPVTPGAPVPTLDPNTGLVDVPAGTPAGTYVITYELCENLNPTNCATGTVTVLVEAPVIIAEDETLAPVRNGVGSSDAGNVLGNDTLNGTSIDPAFVTISVTSPPADPGIVLDTATGGVSITPDVPPGTYDFTYEICENLNPTNCDTAVVSVTVEDPRGAIAGTVFTDQNVNDVQDTGDAPRSGFLVEVLHDGNVVASTYSDADGNYMIEDVLSGDGYTIRFSDPDTGTVYEMIEDVTVLVAATLEDQNLPIDPSGVLYDSVTRAPVSGATVTLVDANGDPLPTACFIDPSQASQVTGVLGEYQFDVVPGAAPQCPNNETVYRIAITPPTGFSAPSTVIAPLDGPFDPTGLIAPVMINSDASPPTGSNPPYYLTFALEAGDPDVIFNHIPLDPFLSRNPLVVVKTSTRRTANVGDIVPYEITVTNQEAVQRADVDVFDILPSGMRYIEGSGFVDGVAQEPETANAGRELVWRDQLIPASTSVTYSLSMVIGAGVSNGEKVNTGVAENGGTGDPISNRGTAVVQIVPSSVFDCSEVIGKVFEDANYNGYQDEGEPGVPGARLATVNGQLITTDEFGRYHIACAVVPNARIGSNYVLKLDPRSLPLGWDVTTNNPRSIRLTRGKFGEVNFGVAPANNRTSGKGSPVNRSEGGE